MKRLGIYDMGKDIDRNITRQLWEREKNVFTRNDVIPVENGGTGVDHLELLYPKLAQDYYVKKIFIINEKLDEGFTVESDSTAFIKLNYKSFYIEGRMHISKKPNISSDKYLKIKLNHGGYNINDISFAASGAKFSIINDTLILEGSFNNNNTYDFKFPGLLVPFI